MAISQWPQNPLTSVPYRKAQRSAPDCWFPGRSQERSLGDGPNRVRRSQVWTSTLGFYGSHRLHMRNKHFAPFLSSTQRDFGQTHIICLCPTRGFTQGQAALTRMTTIRRRPDDFLFSENEGLERYDRQAFQWAVIIFLLKGSTGLLSSSLILPVGCEKLLRDCI